MDIKEQIELIDNCHNDGKIACCDLVILNDEGKVLIQKRSKDRRLYPGCWEIPGGHVEEGEDFFITLKRELDEEIGVELIELHNLIGVYDWESNGLEYRNHQFTGKVKGEPKLLEPEKVDKLRWIGPDELDVLHENRPNKESMHFVILSKYFNDTK